MIECAFCTAEGIQWDTDLEMAMCVEHFNEMNGVVSEIEFSEVWD